MSAGRSLGLVLAGGGARAFAHIGVLRELEEAGYPVNRLAGSEHRGSAVATMYGLGMDGEELEERCYAEFVRRNPFNDWTFPTHAMTRGVRVRASIARVTGDAVLEGLPRPCPFVTPTWSAGPGWCTGAARSSTRPWRPCACPCSTPPIPTDEGRLLMDGGVLDNLPVDLLLERDEGPVVAVNISMAGSSGTRVAARAITRPRVPALGETLLRTMYHRCRRRLDAAHRRGAVVVTPATLGVGLLEFHQLDRMVQAGREAARALHGRRFAGPGRPGRARCRDVRRPGPGHGGAAGPGLSTPAPSVSGSGRPTGVATVAPIRRSSDDALPGTSTSGPNSPPSRGASKPATKAAHASTAAGSAS